MANLYENTYNDSDVLLVQLLYCLSVTQLPASPTMALTMKHPEGSIFDDFLNRPSPFHAGHMQQRRSTSFEAIPPKSSSLCAPVAIDIEKGVPIDHPFNRRKSYAGQLAPRSRRPAHVLAVFIIFVLLMGAVEFIWLLWARPMVKLHNAPAAVNVAAV